MEESRTEVCSNCKREIPAQNMVTHKFHCARNIRVCPSCKEPVPASELEDHHHKFHQLLPCKNCKEPVCGSDLEDHLRDSCAHTIRPCRFCELELPRRELPLHEDYCGTRTELCEQCKQYVMIKYKQLHLDSNHGFLKLDEEPDPRQNRLVSSTPKPMNRSDASTSTNNVPISRVANRIGSIGSQASTISYNNIPGTSQPRNSIQNTSDSNHRSTDVRLQRPLSNYLDRHNTDASARRGNEFTSPTIFNSNVPSTSEYNRNRNQPKVQNQAINQTNVSRQCEIGTNRLGEGNKIESIPQNQHNIGALSVSTSSNHSNNIFSGTNDDTKGQNRSRSPNSTTSHNAFASRDYTEAGTLKLPPKTNNDSNSNRRNQFTNQSGPSISESRPKTTYEPRIANDFSNLRICTETNRNSLVDKSKETNSNDSQDFQRAGPSNERRVVSANAIRSDSNNLDLRPVRNLTNGLINETSNSKNNCVSNVNMTSSNVNDSRLRSNGKTNNQNPRPHSVIVPTKTSYINAVPNTNTLATRVSNRDSGRVNSLDIGHRPSSMPVKRTNDMPQLNTSVQCKNKVQNKATRSPKKRAPKPPAPQPPAQSSGASTSSRDHAYWSALQRQQAETRDRRQRNAYNLEHGLPPVLSAAEKLEKLRKLDKLMRSDLDSTPDRNKAHCSTLPSPAPSTSTQSNNNTVEEEPLEPPEIERISLGEINPMTEEEFQEQVRILEIVYGVKHKDIETEIADLHRAKAKRSVYNTNPTDSNRAQNPIANNKQKGPNAAEASTSNNNGVDQSNRNLPKVLNTQNVSQETGVNQANNNVQIPTASTGAIQKAGSSGSGTSGLHIRTDTEILFGATKAKTPKPLLAGLANKLNLPSVKNSQKNDRFGDIKRELRELRRGLNEVTAPYSGAGGAPRVVASTPPEVHPPPEAQPQLPCEFCALLCHPEDLVMHQSGCRPDLVHGQSASAAPCEEWIPCEFCTEPVPARELMEHQTACSCIS